MTLATHAGSPQPATVVEQRTLVPALAAVSVGLLVAGTLCTVGAVIVGTSLHLLGLPDGWSLAAAALTAAGGLVPTAALTRRVWLVERHGPEA